MPSTLLGSAAEPGRDASHTPTCACPCFGSGKTEDTLHHGHRPMVGLTPRSRSPTQELSILEDFRGSLLRGIEPLGTWFHQSLDITDWSQDLSALRDMIPMGRRSQAHPPIPDVRHIDKAHHGTGRRLQHKGSNGRCGRRNDQ